MPLLGLLDWKIDVQYSNRFEEMGSNVTEPRYKHIRIGFNPQLIIQHCLDLEELVVHELCHAFTWRIWQLANQMISNYSQGSTHKIWDWMLEEIHEQAVTAIGYAIVNTRRHERASFVE